jgi:hypothetical protein
VDRHEIYWDWGCLRSARRDECPDPIRLEKCSTTDLAASEFAATDESVDAALGDPQQLGHLIDRQQRLQRVHGGATTVTACHRRAR